MNVQLPSGKVLQGVPDGTSDEDIMAEALRLGAAVEADFQKGIEETLNPLAQPVVPDGMPMQIQGPTGETFPVQSQGLSQLPAAIDQEVALQEGVLGGLPRHTENRLLQEKYGDKSTHPEVGPSWRRGKMYDRGELEKRYYKDKLGFNPEPSYNPLVHMGKTITDLSLGTKQILGGLPFVDKPSNEEYKEWQKNNMLYEAAGQPLAAQIAGDVAFSIPNLLSAPGKMAASFALKKMGAKNTAKKVAANSYYSGTSASPTLAPFATGAGEGAYYMGAQPLNPEMPAGDQITQRLKMAGIGALTGGAGEIAGRTVGSSFQSGMTNALKKEAQGSLPLPVEIPTPALYSNQPGLDLLNRVSKQEQGIAQSSAKMQLEKYRQSLLDNFEAMNYQASGSKNEQIGHSMRSVLDTYENQHNLSKANMDIEYAKINDYGSIAGDWEDFYRFTNNLEHEFRKEGMPLIKASKSAFKELKNVDHKASADGSIDLYDAKSLMTRYKAINNIFKTAKPAQEPAINLMRKRLMTFMQEKVFYGDPRSVQQFKIATDTASQHYKKFRGDKTIDRYLDGEYTPSDVSKRIFSGEALDYTEAPKAQALNKILEVLPESRVPLRNEVFANLTDEIGRSKVEKAIPKIQQRILSGSEEGVFGSIFTPEQLQQFRDLKLAVDRVENVPDFARGVLRATDLTDMSAIAPQNWLPGTKPLKDLTQVARAEKGKLGPSRGVAHLISTPLIHGVEREREQQLEEEELNNMLIKLYSNSP